MNERIGIAVIGVSVTADGLAGFLLLETYRVPDPDIEITNEMS